MRLDRLVGVYDADGTIRGELAYLIGRTRGTAHCALCDITHGRLRRRADFDDACRALAVPLELRHRDEIDEAVKAAAAGRYPCIGASAPRERRWSWTATTWTRAPAIPTHWLRD